MPSFNRASRPRATLSPRERCTINTSLCMGMVHPNSSPSKLPRAFGLVWGQDPTTTDREEGDPRRDNEKHNRKQRAIQPCRRPRVGHCQNPGVHPAERPARVDTPCVRPVNTCSHRRTAEALRPCAPSADSARGIVRRPLGLTPLRTDDIPIPLVERPG